MDKSKIVIAIDGPAGAGKSTIARAVAGKLKLIYVDTGALYRAIALYAMRQGVKEDVTSLLPEIKLSLFYQDGEQHILLCGEDVTTQIRSQEVSNFVSKISAIAEVRAFLLKAQREIALEHGVVMDGRDIGTVVFPNAQVKIFLTAAPEKRAQRRYLEFLEKRREISFEQVLQDMISRDKMDETRAQAPLKQAQDAVKVDTTELDLEESIYQIIEIIKHKTGI